MWKSTNGGQSWIPLTDDQCSLAMGSIALDPVDPQIIYAGTGEQHFSGDSYYGCGVLRSTDGGASWERLDAVSFLRPNGWGGAKISRVVVDPVTAGSTSGRARLRGHGPGVLRLRRQRPDMVVDQELAS